MRVMTVKELIKALQKYDGDNVVYLSAYDGRNGVQAKATYVTGGGTSSSKYVYIQGEQTGILED